MSLTIDEAIARFEQNAEQNERWANAGLNPEANAEYAAEHTQLAAWLRELQERRKGLGIVRCGECEHKRDLHYEDSGEEPYIKSICENKYGLTKGYQVHDWDFCSRAERRTDG